MTSWCICDLITATWIDSDFIDGATNVSFISIDDNRAWILFLINNLFLRQNRHGLQTDLNAFKNSFEFAIGKELFVKNRIIWQSIIWARLWGGCYCFGRC